MGPRIPSPDRGGAPDESRPGDDERRGEGDGGKPSEEPGNALLRGGSSREILERIFEGDPLEIEARCRERIETRAYLLDAGRLHLRAVARVARAAPGWKGEPSLAEFSAKLFFGSSPPQRPTRSSAPTARGTVRNESPPSLVKKRL